MACCGVDNDTWSGLMGWSSIVMNEHIRLIKFDDLIVSNNRNPIHDADSQRVNSELLWKWYEE